MKSLCLAFLFTISFFHLSAQAPKPGATLPDFVFYKADGSALRNTQVTPGKKTLVMFFDATCSHCQKTMKELSARHSELDKINVYLVSLDQHITMNYFMSQYGRNLTGKKNVTLLEDRDHVFIPLFAPTKYPALYVYSPKSKLTFYTSGDTQMKELFQALKM